MKTDEFATLAIRLLAIYALVKGGLLISNFFSVYWIASDEEIDSASIAFISLALLLPIILSFGLWLMSNRIGSLVSQGLATNIKLGELDAVTLTTVALTVAGILILVFGIPNFIYQIFQHVKWGTQWGQIISQVMLCFLGLILMLKSNHIAKSFFKN